MIGEDNITSLLPGSPTRTGQVLTFLHSAAIAARSSGGSSNETSPPPSTHRIECAESMEYLSTASRLSAPPSNPDVFLILTAIFRRSPPNAVIERSTAPSIARCSRMTTPTIFPLSSRTSSWVCSAGKQNCCVSRVSSDNSQGGSKISCSTASCQGRKTRSPTTSRSTKRYSSVPAVDASLGGAKNSPTVRNESCRQRTFTCTAASGLLFTRHSVFIIHGSQPLWRSE